MDYIKKASKKICQVWKLKSECLPNQNCAFCTCRPSPKSTIRHRERVKFESCNSFRIKLYHDRETEEEKGERKKLEKEKRTKR